MLSDHKLVLAVGKVLLSDWDPIGVHDEPRAQDEYDSYAPTIARLVAEGASTEMIARHLLRIEIEEMSLPPDAARANRAALKLRDIAA